MAGDMEGTSGFLSPDIEIHEPPELPDAQVYYGHEGWRTQLDRFDEAFTDLSYSVIEHIDGGEEDVVTVIRVTGTAPSSGIPGEMTYAELETWRDGQVVSLRYFLSREAALQAAGAA